MLPVSEPSLHLSSWLATICRSASSSLVRRSNCNSWGEKERMCQNSLSIYVLSHLQSPWTLFLPHLSLTHFEVLWDRLCSPEWENRLDITVSTGEVTGIRSCCKTVKPNPPQMWHLFFWHWEKIWSVQWGEFWHVDIYFHLNWWIRVKQKNVWTSSWCKGRDNKDCEAARLWKWLSLSMRYNQPRVWIKEAILKIIIIMIIIQHERIT